MITSYIDNNLKDKDDPRKNGEVLTENFKSLWRRRIMNYRLK